LCARRPGRSSALEKAFPADRTERLSVRAMSLGATRLLLAERLGLRLTHHLLRRVYGATLGNPLFSIEVGRQLAGRNLLTLGEDVPVPDDVEDLLGMRVADLEGAVRRTLLALRPQLVGGRPPGRQRNRRGRDCRGCGRGRR